MIICVRCSPDIKAKMDKLVASGAYADYSEVIGVAVENLCVISAEMDGKKASIIVKDVASALDGNSSSRVEAPATGFAHAPGTPGKKPRSKSTLPKSVTINRPHEIPEMFLSEGLAEITCNTVDIPSKENFHDRFTVDRWIFGQYNKLLPLKANCRAVLRLAAAEPDGVPLEESAWQISESAALLGDYLSNLDQRHQIARDESLATAFPRSGPDAEKGRDRYANQFVGSVNSHGILSGLLWDYRMAAIVPGEIFLAPDKRSRWEYRLGASRPDEGPRLALTESGLQFARLANPVLDRSQVDPSQKFSREEAAFLLDHIRHHVPVEAFAFRTIIKAVTDGANTPDKLDEALRHLVPSNTHRALSPSFLNSQRSGALSRMADLGLITRERRGVRVSYVVTEQGQRLIEAKSPFGQGENRS